MALAGEPRSGAQGVPWLWEVAQKQEGSGRSSPRGSRRSESQRRTAGDADWRRSGSRARDPDGARLRRAPGLLVSMSGDSVTQRWGSSRYTKRRRREIRRAAQPYPRRRPARFRRGGRLGSMQRAQGDSLDRGEAIAGHGGVCTAAGRRALGGAEERRPGGARCAAWKWGCGGGCGMGLRVPGGALYRAAQAILGVRAQGKSRRRLRVGRCCASGGCGRKGKGRQVGPSGQRKRGVGRAWACALRV